MRVGCTITVVEPDVDGKQYDEVTIDWITETDGLGVTTMSQEWIDNKQRSLTRWMIGLRDYRSASLSLRPVDDVETSTQIKCEPSG